MVRQIVRLRRTVYTLLLIMGLVGLLGWIVADAGQLPWSPGGSQPAAAHSKLRPLTTGKVMDGFGAWSPDGRQIAFMRDGHIWVMNAGGGNARALTSGTSTWDTVPAWRPDGKMIACVRHTASGEAARIMQIDPRTGAEQQLVAQSQAIGYVAWDPTGASLYYTMPTQLMRFNLKTGQSSKVIEVPAGWDSMNGGLAIRPDGRVAVFGAGPVAGRNVQYDLWAIDLTPGRVAGQTEGQAEGQSVTRAANQGEPLRLTTGGGIMPAFDPAGKRVAYRNPRRETGIYVMDLTTHTTGQVIADEPRAMYFHPAFSPDGRTLLVSKLILPENGQGGFISNLYLFPLTTPVGN